MRLVLTLAALLLSSATTLAAPLALHRGVGVHEWLNWSPLAADGSYRWPPYRSEEEWLSQYRPMSDWPKGDELERISSLGFDFIRLTVDPGPLMASDGDKRQQALSVLSIATRTAVSAGLNVVFNLHANSQVPQYGIDAVNAGANADSIRAYEQVAADVAGMLMQIGPAHVAIEPFNEPAYYPCDTSGSEDWQHITEATVKAIRAVAPGLTIVVTGACGGSITGLTDLDPTTFDDPDILYSLHMYEPHAFTHQRDDEGGWYSGFPWPSDAVDRETVLDGLKLRMQAAGAGDAEIAQALGAVGQKLDAYQAGDWDAEKLDDRIKEATDWADRHGIPTTRLFMGEFGAILMSADGKSGAADADRLRYVTAVREAAERYGIPWSIWEYSNPYGMTVIEPTGPAVPDQPLLKALGL